MSERGPVHLPARRALRVPEMMALWSPARRTAVAAHLARARGSGTRVWAPMSRPTAIDDMRAHLDDIDFERVAEYEQRFRHDVMAHVHAFADAAPAARRVIHLGATSADITDNADLIQLRVGLGDPAPQDHVACCAPGRVCAPWRAEPTLGYTHLQPAQLTTVGKRATLWMQDLVLDLAELDHGDGHAARSAGSRGRRARKASFLELFHGDADKVRDLDRLVTTAIGFGARAGGHRADVHPEARRPRARGRERASSASAAKFSGDIRMLQAFGEIEEPFESRAGRLVGHGLQTQPDAVRADRRTRAIRRSPSKPNANQTHSVQYFERTLDDSANRRLVLPESFLAADAILVLMANIAGGLEVHPARIRQRVEDELPFMATEEMIVRAVRAGGDRQAAHETHPPPQHGGGAAVKRRARATTTCWSGSPATPAFPACSVDDLRPRSSQRALHRARRGAGGRVPGRGGRADPRHGRCHTWIASSATPHPGAGCTYDALSPRGAVRV